MSDLMELLYNYLQENRISRLLGPEYRNCVIRRSARWKRLTEGLSPAQMEDLEAFLRLEREAWEREEKALFRAALGLGLGLAGLGAER